MSIELALKALIAEVLAEAGVIKATGSTSIPPGIPALASPEAAPAKRGRGRPARGEDTPPAAPAASQAVVDAADPFATTTPAAPAASLEDVRTALKALQAASSQTVALGVLKTAGGADNLASLSADKYGAVVVAAKTTQAQYAKAPAPEPADPFDAPAAPLAATAALTRDDVKKEIIAAQQRTGTDTVQKIVMKHGGKATNAETGREGPSLSALPESAFHALVVELKSLPSTK